MEDKQFLNLLQQTGFTPSFYVSEQYDIDYYVEQYDTESLQEVKEKILKLVEQKDVLQEKLGDTYYTDTLVNTIETQICDLQGELTRTILQSVGEFEVIKEKGGTEGAGEDYYLILYFKDHDKYVRSDGDYYSYDGVSNLCDWYIVRPQEKTIIVYEPVGTINDIYPV